MSNGEQKTANNQVGDKQALEQANAELAQNRKAAKNAIIFKSVALVIMLIYLSWLYAMVKKIDADSVVSMTALNFKNNLPSYAQQLQTQLKSSAPAFIADLEKSSYDAIPEIRMNLQQSILKETGKLTGKLQADLGIVLAEAVKKQKAKIMALPKLSPAQKLDKLTMFIMNDFKQMSYEMSDQLTLQLAKDVSDLNNQLKRLQSSYGLTEKEQLEKKMLGVWAKLMNIKMKQGIKL